MQIRGVLIEDTFAEAFGMRAARVVITAKTMRWAREAALKFTGFATSVIACKCEAAIERALTPDETPDGRPGVSVLLFTMDTDSLGKRLMERIGQTVLTCPTTNCFDGLPAMPDRLAAGRAVRTFGDRFQISKVVGGQRYWRIPVMEGEFLLQESFGVQKKGVGGGNFLILGETADVVLEAAEAAVAAIDGTPDVIMPFPGGIVRSGSKVGARGYAGMIASTNDAYAPTLRPLTASALPDGVGSVLEIVLDGLSAEAVGRAMRTGIDAACRPGVRAISAGNYGGKLGPYHFRLREIMGSGLGARDSGLGTPGSGLGDRGSGIGDRGLGVGGWGLGAGDRRRAERSAVITMTLRTRLDALLDLEGVAPDQCAALSGREIAALPVVSGGRLAALGDFFTVSGERSPHVRMVGDLSRANRVGAGMAGGTIVVEGDVGDEAGLAMSGGALRIDGSAGERLGAARPGASRGMTGGEIVVTGSAGRGAAARLRRGLIVVGGDVGDDPACDIIAGTLVVLGRTGSRPGLRSKRGSIVAAGPIEVPSTYRYACTFEPPFTRLLLTYLRRTYQLTIPDAVVHGRYHRHCGDAGVPGKGEILERATSSRGCLAGRRP